MIPALEPESLTTTVSWSLLSSAIRLGLHQFDRLGGRSANGSVGAASAALVLAVALLVTVSFGPAAPAVAQDSTTATETVEPAAPVYQPIDIDGLEGFQLPTK